MAGTKLTRRLGRAAVAVLGTLAFAAPAHAAVVEDGGFESATGAAPCGYTSTWWTLNTGAEICDQSPRTGIKHGSLRVPNGNQNDPSITQQVTLPDTPNDVTLRFYLHVASLGNNNWTFEARLDGTVLWQATRPDVTPTYSGGYSLVEVSVPASLTDGGSYPLTFRLQKDANAGTVRHNVDDVEIVTQPDETAPNTVFIPGGPSGKITDSTPTFEFSSTEPVGDSFECRIDTGPWLGCGLAGNPASETLPQLADGQHTFRVRATDAAGNTDPSPAARVFTVDTTGPDTAIVDGPGALTNDTTPSFDFTSTEAVTPAPAGFECSMDGAGFTPCTDPYTHAPALTTDGLHEFRVRAIDDVGNADQSPAVYQFTLDTTAPLSSITSGPLDPSSDLTPEFEFASNEALATFECRLTYFFATLDWFDCSSPLEVGPLDDGNWSLQVRAIDQAGNVGVPNNAWFFTIDATEPQTQLDTGPAVDAPVVTSDPTPTFTFSSPETPVTFECRLDGGNWQACTSPRETTALADGPHVFRVRATDSSGNTDSSPAVANFVVDQGPPDTILHDKPANPTQSTNADFTFTSSEPGSTFECALNTDTFAPCGTPFAGTAVAGSNTFRVRAIDAAGNADPTPATYTWTVDNVAPDTSITNGPGEGSTISDRTPTFEFSSDESPNVTFECRLTAGANPPSGWVPCTSPHTTGELDDGTHVFEVRARDAVGNVDPTPASRTFVVDGSAPQTTLTSGPNVNGANPITTDPTPTFTFIASEAATFECMIDAGNWFGCSSPQTLTTLADGEHTFQVRATDLENNTDPTPAQTTFIVDTGKPVVEITNAPPALTTNNDPVFEFVSNEADSTFECSLDSGDNADYTACTTPKQYLNVADGEHTFYVRAVDAAGNRSAPDTHTWRIDTTAPVVTIDNGPPVWPASFTTTNTPTFNYSADEPVAKFECRLNAGTWVECGSGIDDQITLGPLADGIYTFEVRGVDGAGNTGAPASRTFNVDTTAPTVVITSGPPADGVNPFVTFKYESTDDPAATFECRLDGGAWGPCPGTGSGTKNYGPLSDGPHTFEVRGVDLAGNRGVPATYTFNIGTRCGVPTTNNILGTNGNNAIAGTEGNDRIDGAGGTDTIRSYGGDDCVAGGSGFDSVRSDGGNDFIDLLDKAAGDKVRCDEGEDTVYMDRGDLATSDCEHVYVFN